MTTTTSDLFRLIAFYLPQYHPIPENDAWWGRGFTEWTNVAKARPLFPHHYQPHLPADLGFYDLRVPETRRAQADLAREYGIYGFCYYHYWFNGKQLLDRPFNEVLTSGEPDFPFCLCWANENWTRAWDGLDQDVLIEQRYSLEDDRQHIRWFIKAFQDSRYIRIDGRPLLLVYRISNLPNASQTASIWREEAHKAGVGDLYLATVESLRDDRIDPAAIGFDAAVEFQPNWLNMGAPARQLDGTNTIYDYASVVEHAVRAARPSYTRFPGIMPGWDNSSRRAERAIVLDHSTPERYGEWLASILANNAPRTSEENLVFVNAWNEWGEGAHLEPCQRWGRGYLEATHRALRSVAQRTPLPSPDQAVVHVAGEPKVSICIPTYNGESYVREAIDSVLGQSLGDFELVIVDDCSTDATEREIRSFRDRRIRYYRNSSRLGLAGNWNRCIELARAPYVCVFHQDDVMQPDNLEKKIAVLAEAPSVGMVHSNVFQIDASGGLLSRWWYAEPTPEDGGIHRGAEYFEKLLLGKNVVCCPSVVVRRECFERLGGFDPRLPFTADWEMWMRIALHYDVAYLTEPLLSYRRHAAMETAKFPGVKELEHALAAKRAVLDGNEDRIPDATSLRMRVARSVRDEAAQRALECHRDQRHAEAEAYTAFAAMVRENIAGQSTESDRAPGVSVVVSCRDTGAYLDHTVQSVLEQTFDDLEIIIVDDASTDAATHHMLTSYIRPRTRVFRREHRGAADARNFGFEVSEGRYIAFLEAGDVLGPAFLERSVHALDTDPTCAFVLPVATTSADPQVPGPLARCTFPDLFAGDTTHCAAVIRREALEQVGGFDPSVPVAGYESWELALSLTERVGSGIVIREDYYQRHPVDRSASGVGARPSDHTALVKYVVERHRDSIKRLLPSVLEAIERGTHEVESGGPQDRANEPSAYHARHLTFLEDSLRSVVQSRSWRLGLPLRQAFGWPSKIRRRLDGKAASSPRVAVVVTCGENVMDLQTTLDDLWPLVTGGAQLIVAHDGSADALLTEVLAWHGEAGIDVVRTPGVGLPRSREAALARVRAPVVFALSAGEHIESTALDRALQVLEADDSAAFVAFDVLDSKSGFLWRPESLDLHGLVACPRVGFPVVRTAALSRAGGYDGSYANLWQADWDLMLELASRDERGAALSESIACRRSDTTITAVVDKHRALFEAHWARAVLAHDNLRWQLRAHREGARATAPGGSASEPVEWGGLRRLEPMSHVWGFDRGQPVDRYFIEQFLDQHRSDIRGRVLEVKDPVYTQAFGGEVEESHVVDIAPSNAAATLVCDLASDGSLPECVYDCFILTQTIHIIYQTRAVLANAYRTLRPGGVLLATLPCVSRVDYESGRESDFWRYTPASARRLFEEAFGAGQVEVISCGNVLVCLSFLMGLAACDLTDEELNHRDPYFPLLVCVRAVKAETPVFLDG